AHGRRPQGAAARLRPVDPARTPGDGSGRADPEAGRERPRILDPGRWRTVFPQRAGRLLHPREGGRSLAAPGGRGAVGRGEPAAPGTAAPDPPGSPPQRRPDASPARLSGRGGLLRLHTNTSLQRRAVLETAGSRTVPLQRALVAPPTAAPPRGSGRPTCGPSRGRPRSSPDRPLPDGPGPPGRPSSRARRRRPR